MQQDPERTPDRLSQLKQFGELGNAALKWITVVPGSICMLLYSVKMGQFPEGLALGEGLAFYLICAAFWIAFSLYVGAASVLGVVVAGPLMAFFERRKRARAVGSGHLLHMAPTTSFAFSKDPMLRTIAAVVLAADLVLALKWWQDSLQFLLMALIQGAALCFLVEIVAKLRWLRQPLVHADSPPAEVQRSVRGLKQARAGLGAALLLVPLLVGPQGISLVDAAFRAAQLRKDHATIHVKKPWAIRVVRSGLVAHESFMGEDYAEFRDVTVLLRSVGTKVVVELPGTTVDGTTVKLPVPAAAIEVE